MIPFETWLPQIIAYCRFIADIVGTRRAWVQGDYSCTSVTDFDELYEQIFDDLASDDVERKLTAYLPNDVGAREALSAFLRAIRAIDKLREKDRALTDSAALLRSGAWKEAMAAAERVTRCFDEAPVKKDA